MRHTYFLCQYYNVIDASALLASLTKEFIRYCFVCLFVFQVSPSTLLITECEEPLIKEITLTPTIPIRPNFKGGYLTVTFYLPDGLWLVNKEKCFVDLKGTTPVKVKVGATCTTLTGLRKSIVITPKITNGDDSMFWALFGLPTVWVCIMYVVLALLLIVILPFRRSRDKVTHTSRSVTRFLRALLLPPGWDASPSQGFSPLVWQGLGFETATFRSEVQHANYYTTALL